MTMSWAVLLFLCSWWRWCRGSRLWSLFLFSTASVLLLLLVSFGFSLLYTLTVPLVSNLSVFFPSFLSVLSSLVQTSLHPPLSCASVGGIYRAKGSGGVLIATLWQRMGSRALLPCHNAGLAGQ